MSALWISTVTSRHAANTTPVQLSWNELALRLAKTQVTSETEATYASMSKPERDRIKDVGGFIGGKSVDGLRKSDSFPTRDIVSLDADYAKPDFAEAWDMLVGYTACIHTTHSHTHDTPRLRVVCPLTRPVTTAEYPLIARHLAHMAGMEQFDTASFKPAQIMYWPSTPADGEFRFWEVGVDWVNPDEILAQYGPDWTDVSRWPGPEGETAQARTAVRRVSDPLAKPGWIGAYNRTHSISDVLDSVLSGVYTHVSGDRYTYAGGTSVGGAIIYDNDTILYSHHDTDPAHGHSVNAFDLVRIHKFGHLDAEYNGPLGSAPSMKAMEEFCAADPDVFQEKAARDAEENHLEPVDDGIKRYANELTDRGFANMFKDTYGGNILYNPQLEWLFWNGTKWLSHANLHVEALAQRWVHRFIDETIGMAVANREAEASGAEKPYDDAYMKLRNKAEKTLRSRHLITGILPLIVSDTGILVDDPEAFDANPWDLNTPAGIVDLRTGEMRESDPDALCTKITKCSPGATENAGMWREFIQFITGGDVDFEQYLQTAIGMAAVGDVMEEGVFIAHGCGANGKSTFFGAVYDVLGEYSKTIEANALVRKRGMNQNQFASAELYHKRYALLSETDDGDKMSSADLKALSSHERIAGNQKYGKLLEFKPTHTLFVQTNHLPRLDEFSLGTKRRIRVLTFPTTVAPDRVVTDMRQRLVAECGPDIMQWIIDGAVRFWRSGCRLNEPEVVRRSTESYFDSEDTIGCFLRDCCEFTGNNRDRVAGKLLYGMYQTYCSDLDADPKYSRTFYNRLRDMGAQPGGRESHGNERLIYGIKLRDDTCDTYT